jgi:HrpA-like RNA helicase
MPGIQLILALAALQFTNNQITVMVGETGSGKTTQ